MALNVHHISVTIMNDIFQPRAVSYNLSSQADYTRPNIDSKHFRNNSLRHLPAKVWDMVLNVMINVNDAETFKNNIRKWQPANCNCELCIDYVSCVGYVDTFLLIPTLHLWNVWRASLVSECLGKNAGHWPVSLPETSLFRGSFLYISLRGTGYLVFLYLSNVYTILSVHLIFIVIFNIFLKTSGGASRTPIESGVGLSVTNGNNSSLSFVTESSILDFMVV